MTEANTTKLGIKDFAFGIEIETVGLGIAGCVNAIASIIGNHGTRSLHNFYRTQTVAMEDGRKWKVETDASIAGRNGAEVVSPKLNYSDIEMLQNIVRALRSHGAKVNYSCGIHIHIDGAPFIAKPKALANLCKLVNQQEDLMQRAFGTTASRTQQWCRPVNADFIAAVERTRGRSLNAIRTAWYASHGERDDGYRYNNSRYHGMNIHALFMIGTVEFRYFNATLHAGKIKSYIQFILALASKAYNARSARASKRKHNANVKYAFRCFLLSLKLIGAEYKTCRHHMLKDLPGTQNGIASKNHPAGFVTKTDTADTTVMTDTTDMTDTNGAS